MELIFSNSDELSAQFYDWDSYVALIQILLMSHLKALF
jgi:hypothetical protein